MKIKLLTILKSAAVVATFASSGYFIYRQIQKRSEQLEEEEYQDDPLDEVSQESLNKSNKSEENKPKQAEKTGQKTKKPRKKSEKNKNADDVRRTKTNRVRKEKATGELYKDKTVYQGQQGGKYYYNKKGNKTYLKED